MHLQQIVFYSLNKAKPATGSMRELVKEILRSCTQYNRVPGLSGALIFNESHFLQAMEGPRASISQLLWHLAADNRHSEMVLVSARPVERRDFEGWMVGFAGHSEDLDALYLRYGTSAKLDPSQLSAKSAVDLLQDFARLDGSHVVQRTSATGQAGGRDAARQNAA